LTSRPLSQQEFFHHPNFSLIGIVVTNTIFIIIIITINISGVKIVALLIKTVAKPLSKRIKHEFSKNPTTSNGLIFIGQTTHAISSRLTIWSAGYKVRTITPLSNDDALKEGSEVVGEAFILTVSIGALIWEYNKSKEKERKKEKLLHDQAAAERLEIQQSIYNLEQRIITLENKNVMLQQQQQQRHLDQNNGREVRPSSSFLQYLFGKSPESTSVQKQQS
jgi:optic atrophy 3 protein